MVHRHTEAFCWMYYEPVTDKTKGAWIYNSRDGVTPFMVSIDGLPYQHAHWDKDLYKPNYVPVPGDLIFITVNEDQLRAAYAEVLKEMRADGEDVPDDFFEATITKHLEDEAPALMRVGADGVPVDLQDPLVEKIL